jgi:hypothetical protein
MVDTWKTMAQTSKLTVPTAGTLWGPLGTRLRLAAPGNLLSSILGWSRNFVFRILRIEKNTKFDNNLR